MAGTGNGGNGEKRGRGRPKHEVRHLQDLAACEGLLWWKSPEIIGAMIHYALNGSDKLLVYLGERIWGRPGDRPPIIDRTEQLKATLPEGFDPEAMMATITEQLTGVPQEGAWTTAEAARVGQMGLAGLVQRARRGDGQAQALFAKLWLGDPILSLGDQAATMTPDQLRATMIARYSAAWPWLGREEIERMVAAISGGSKPAEEAG
jgi:hypothetical protein